MTLDEALAALEAMHKDDYNRDGWAAWIMLDAVTNRRRRQPWVDMNEFVAAYHCLGRNRHVVRGVNLKSWP